MSSEYTLSLFVLSSKCAQWLSWPKWSNCWTSCYSGGLQHLILCAMKILSDANMINRFAYLSSGSVMVPMTVWMVQMKYFVKIKEGVKSKAMLYISSTLKVQTNLVFFCCQAIKAILLTNFLFNTLFRTPLLFMNNPEKCFPEKFFMCDIGLCITKGPSMFVYPSLQWCISNSLEPN